jgi:hypothetical protein
MDARFASWRRRYPDGWDETTWRAVRARAERLEAEVCRAAGIEPSGVRRLSWTAEALRAAGAGAGGTAARPAAGGRADPHRVAAAAR